VFLYIIIYIRALHSPFGDDDDTAHLAHAVRFVEVHAQVFQGHVVFRYENRFGTGSQAGVQGDEAGVTAHDFDDCYAVVGIRRIANAVDALQDRVDRRIKANRIFCAIHVVIDGTGNDDSRNALLAQRLGTAHRTVAADDDEGVNVIFADIGSGFLLCLFFHEFQAACRAQHRAATVDNTAYITPVERHDFVAQKTFVAADDTGYG